MAWVRSFTQVKSSPSSWMVLKEGFLEYGVDTGLCKLLGRSAESQASEEKLGTVFQCSPESSSLSDFG